MPATRSPVENPRVPRATGTVGLRARSDVPTASELAERESDRARATAGRHFGPQRTDSLIVLLATVVFVGGSLWMISELPFI